MRKFGLPLSLLVVLSIGISGSALAEAPFARLGQQLTPLSKCLGGQVEELTLSAEAQLPIDGKPQSIHVRLIRRSDGYEFSAKHADYSLLVQRTADATRLSLPHHQVTFLGTGETDDVDHLAASGILQRLVSMESRVGPILHLVQTATPESLVALLSTLVSAEFDAQKQVWTFDSKVTASLSDDGTTIQLQAEDVSVGLVIDLSPVEAETRFTAVDANQVVEIDRSELERTIVRGLRRATEILSPGPLLTQPAQQPRQAAHGELRWIDGHRVCLLQGDPAEVGQAHGQLLKREALKTIDSVLYTFAFVNTVRTGRWFRHELDDAYARLASHIPEDHKRETAAMAAAVGIDAHVAQTLNVFPELFHCSGFAVFDSATQDGTLYHGRVLDYMTTIGLQDAATTFIVSVEGKIPFANVGYAGFIGSVTGMNARSVSLGEMGGRGEGQWDGVPMATLMRRALEECSTLDEVMTLWRESPRTCEYYYVFADGKTNRAVGVAATPEKIEFVQPGESHELLGEGIPDAVVLSAGSRLEKLRQRVQSKHGEIDEEAAIWLMSRPVAMQSNLHNALFVPAKGILYVANADHKHPAAEQPYVKLDLHKLLKSSVDRRNASAAPPR